MPSEALKNELQQKVDQRLKRLFLAKGSFGVSNYRPPTGIGLFDFDYQIGGAIVDVKVKARFNFLNHIDNHDKQKDYIDWTGPDKANFKRKALAVCEEAWSEKHRFQCLRPGWDAINAKVKITIVEDNEHPHYIIDCRKTAETHSGAWAGGCSHGASVWPYNANFSNWGVEKRADFFGDKLFNFKERQLLETLKQSNLAIIPMTGDNVSMSQAVNLMQVAQKCNRIVESDVTGIHCYVYGFSKSTKFIGQSLGEKRAIAVQGHLNHQMKGTKNFFHASTKKESKTKAEGILRGAGINPATFEGVCLFIYVPPKSPRSVPTNYIVITHEFGHMLGCPDEYTGVNCTGIKELMGLDQLVPNAMAQNLQNASKFNPIAENRHFSTETMKQGTVDNVTRLQKQQVNYASMLQESGVTSPYFMSQSNTLNETEVQEAQQKWYIERDRLKGLYGKDDRRYKAFAASSIGVEGKTGITDSIMFSGQKILAAHYLPIWSCLTSCTREYLDPSEWGIV